MSDVGKQKQGENKTKRFELSAQTWISDDDAQRIENEKESQVADTDADKTEESDSE
jgi:hypothetical protein